MENKVEVEHYDRFFGNCEVLWKIENFCLVITRDNCNLHSSKFHVTGPELTMWQFIFTPKMPNTSSMRLYLRRLNDDGPVCVSVNWALTIGSLTDDCYYSEYKHDFEKLAEIGKNVSDLSKILSVFEPFECDTLVIRCHMIVDYMNKFVKLNKPKTLGLQSLAENLGLMFKSGKDKDVILQVEKSEILVHKVVLSRNGVLQKLIHNKHASYVELPNLNSEAVKNYVDYLYTGNLNKVLQNPSISMYNCLKAMDMDLLKCYFALEELKLHTKVKVDEFEHLWLIKNFGSRKEESLTSSHFKQTNKNITWQLTIYLHGIDDNDYLSIFADVVNGNKPENVCLEFALEDSLRETYLPRRILSYNETYCLGIRNFVNNACLTNTTLVSDDNLKLAFKVRIWDSGDYYSITGCRLMSFTTVTERSPYNELSKSLLNIYRSGIYTDIIVVTVGAVFEAHRCILSARSPILSSMIKKMTNKKTLILNDIAPDILKRLLEYIYSGNLLDLDHQALVKLCQVAETYKILSLATECQQVLRNKVKIHS